MNQTLKDMLFVSLVGMHGKDAPAGMNEGVHGQIFVRCSWKLHEAALNFKRFLTCGA